MQIGLDIICISFFVGGWLFNCYDMTSATVMINASDNATAVLRTVTQWNVVWALVIILFAIYILVVLVILINHADFPYRSYYVLLVALALTDYVSLMLVIYRSTWGKAYTRSIMDSTIVFVYQSLGWHNGLLLNVSLAINRFVATTCDFKYIQVFTVYRAKVISALCALTAIVTQDRQYFMSQTNYYLSALVIGNTLIASMRLLYIISAGICMKNWKLKITCEKSHTL